MEKHLTAEEQDLIREQVSVTLKDQIHGQKDVVEDIVPALIKSCQNDSSSLKRIIDYLSAKAIFNHHFGRAVMLSFERWTDESLLVSAMSYLCNFAKTVKYRSPQSLVFRLYFFDTLYYILGAKGEKKYPFGMSESCRDTLFGLYANVFECQFLVFHILVSDLDMISAKALQRLVPESRTKFYAMIRCLVFKNSREVENALDTQEEFEVKERKRMIDLLGFLTRLLVDGDERNPGIIGDVTDSIKLIMVQNEKENDGKWLESFNRLGKFYAERFDMLVSLLPFNTSLKIVEVMDKAGALTQKNYYYLLDIADGDNGFLLPLITLKSVASIYDEACELAFYKVAYQKRWFNVISCLQTVFEANQMVSYETQVQRSSFIDIVIYDKCGCDKVLMPFDNRFRLEKELDYKKGAMKVEPYRTLPKYPKNRIETHYQWVAALKPDSPTHHLLNDLTPEQVESFLEQSLIKYGKCFWIPKQRFKYNLNDLGEIGRIKLKFDVSEFDREIGFMEEIINPLNTGREVVNYLIGKMRGENVLLPAILATDPQEDERYIPKDYSYLNFQLVVIPPKSSSILVRPWNSVLAAMINYRSCELLADLSQVLLNCKFTLKRVFGDDRFAREPEFIEDKLARLVKLASEMNYESKFMSEIIELQTSDSLSVVFTAGCYLKELIHRHPSVFSFDSRFSYLKLAHFGTRFGFRFMDYLGDIVLEIPYYQYRISRQKMHRELRRLHTVPKDTEMLPFFKKETSLGMGPKREFFSLGCAHFVKSSIWRFDKSQGLYPSPLAGRKTMKRLGCFMDRSFREFVRLELDFHEAFFCAMAGLSDDEILSVLDPQLYQLLKDTERVKGLIGEEYLVPGYPEIKIKYDVITEENLSEYIVTIKQHLVNRRAIKALLSSFSYPAEELFKLFDPYDLIGFFLLGKHDPESWTTEAILRGINFENAPADSPQPLWFASWLSSLSDPEKEQFLKWSSGTTRLPFGVWPEGDPSFTITIKSDYNKLPSVHTCVYYITMKAYDNQKDMIRDMRMAIAQTGDGFQFH